MPLFIAYHSRADWDSFCDHLRDTPSGDIFELGTSDPSSEFCELIQVRIDVYIPHRKNQVNAHSSPWFSAVYAAAIAHRNNIFRLYQQKKSSKSKVKFRQASNCRKRFLNLLKSHMLIKQKSLSLSTNLTLLTFDELLIVFSTKVNLP